MLDNDEKMQVCVNKECDPDEYCKAWGWRRMSEVIGSELGQVFMVKEETDMVNIINSIENLKKLKIDVIRHEILGARLSTFQFGILLQLIISGDQFLTRNELRDNLGINSISERTIDVHIKRIRDKYCDPDFHPYYPIESSHKRGYRIFDGFLKKLDFGDSGFGDRDSENSEPRIPNP